MITITTQYGTLNTMLNRLDRPLYSEAVYGIMKMNTMMDAAIFRLFEPKRFSKKSGIVLVSRCLVMIRVRRPRISHARSEPMNALPRPTQVLARPKFHPNCPA